MSPHFAKTIDNQEIYVKPGEKENEKPKLSETKKIAAEKKGESKDDHDKDDAPHSRNRIDTGNKGPVKKKAQDKKGKTAVDQPSLRWKDVDITQSGGNKERVESPLVRNTFDQDRFLTR